jgi:GNAT superfamily N-acetyltransferase
VTERAPLRGFTVEELARGTRGAALDEWLAVRNAIDLWSMSPDGFALREASELASLRLGARVDGNLVAVAHASTDAFQTEQHEAAVRIYVLPEHRGHGIGSALFERLAAFVRERGLTIVVSRVDAGDTASLAFAERRGLRVHGMQQLGAFDLATVDRGRPPVLPDGVTVVALEERPDLQRAVFDLLVAAIPEVPSLTDLAPTSFETWREMLQEPSYRHDLSLIAIDGEGVAGHIEVTDDGDRRAFISMLAVAPRARRRGIARGLKVALAHRAASAGWRELVTLNDGTNERIRQLNESLGYRYLPESLLLTGPVGGG